MGKAKKKKAKAKAKKKYLHVPQHIMEITELGTAEKLLLAHIYSFGAKGCWQSNETLGKLFDVAPRTIKRRLTRIKKFVYVRSPHSRLRTFLAKSHPDVRKMAISERVVRHVQQGQDCPPSRGTELSGIRDKSDPTNGTEQVPQQGQNCPPTITYTSTETSKSTPASAPGPDEETRRRFEQIKAEIIARRRPGISQEEFEKRKARALKRIREAEKLDRAFKQPTVEERQKEFERRKALLLKQLREAEELAGCSDKPEAPAAQPSPQAPLPAQPREHAGTTCPPAPSAAGPPG